MSFSLAATTKLIAKTYTPASGTNTTNEEILQSLQIGAQTVRSGDMLEIFAALSSTNSAGTKTYRIYVNTSNSLTGATIIAIMAFTTNNVSRDIHRYIPIISDTVMFMQSGTATNLASMFDSSNGTPANVTVPSVSAGFWIIITGQKTSGTDTDTVNWVMVRNSSNT